MDSSMSNSISDQLHVAQQSRREKLRVQHCSSPVRSSHQVDDYTSGLEVILPVFNPGLYQVGDNVRNASNFLYQPAGTSSELLLNFSSSIYNSSIKSAEDDHGSVAVNCTNLASSDVNCSRKPGRESNLENFGVWKSIGSYSNSDNWNTDCDDRYRKNTSLGIESDSSASGMRSKHRAAIRCQNHFQYAEMNCGSQMNYSNALNDEVTTALVGLQPDCRVSGNTCMSWGNHGRDKEHNHIVPCGYQSDRELILSGSTWNREMNSMHSRLDQLVVDSHSQGLSLSLCSNPATSMIAGSQYEDVHIPQSKPPQEVANNSFHDSIPFNPTNYCVRPAGVGQGNSLQKPVGPSANYHQQTGPLGPFTGYATILKNSRFLKPAQQLLDEYCGVIGKFSSCSTPVISDRNTVKVDDLATAVNSIESEVGSTGVILGVSTSTHQESDGIIEGAASSQGESYQPDYQLKQAKLLYMLEEVSRRYKQYYQQMQLVASAFESVAGLAAATPYISSALRTVARHFNHLKNAISDQLRHIKTFLGEDFSLTACGIRKKGDLNTKRLKFTDHSFQKQKSGGSITGLIEPQQHIWRPQRGLPERAVSVLKAWLFEHFLHPYPTDTDKLMLATQTGLTRSQVSNWFINARVRLWKPMVEEIHMLERKGLSESDAVDNDNVSSNGVDPHLKADHSMNTMVGTSVPNANLECSGMASLSEMADAQVAKQWNREPRLQVNNHIMNCMDQGKMSVSPYHQTGQEMSGIGSVSLTLGLRQSADQMYLLDGSQHLHPHSQYFQQQQQQDRIRQHLGGHTVHEYAG